MRKILAATLATVAAAAALTTGTGAASAAPLPAETGSASSTPLIADLAVYKLPTVPGNDCTLGVTNNGPGTVDVLISPAYFTEKGYYRQLGTLAPGQSTTTSYTYCGGQASYHPDFLYVSGASYDPNPFNNVFLLHL